VGRARHDGEPEDTMLVKNEERVEHLLNEVVEFARGRLPEPTFNVIEPFLRGYYEQVDVEDIQSRDPADLYGAAMAHWQTAQKFVTGIWNSTAGIRTIRSSRS
jgi:glutamate dehydrogenase